MYAGFVWFKNKARVKPLLNLKNIDTDDDTIYS